MLWKLPELQLWKSYELLQVHCACAEVILLFADSQKLLSDWCSLQHQSASFSVVCAGAWAEGRFTLLKLRKGTCVYDTESSVWQGKQHIVGVRQLNLKQ